MKNGDVREFVNHIHYGDELWFLYEGKKYFLEGWTNNSSLDLCLYEMADNGEMYIWKGNTTHYPVDAFLEAKIWNGKTFWDVEKQKTGVRTSLFHLNEIKIEEIKRKSDWSDA